MKTIQEWFESMKNKDLAAYLSAESFGKDREVESLGEAISDGMGWFNPFCEGIQRGLAGYAPPLIFNKEYWKGYFCGLEERSYQKKKTKEEQK